MRLAIGWRRGVDVTCLLCFQLCQMAARALQFTLEP